MKDHELFERISIINVKNKLNLSELYSRGDTIFVKCPFCKSEKGRMKLIISNNSYICDNCGERGYAIGLYAKCKYLTNKQAYKELIYSKANMTNNFMTPSVINEKRSNDDLDIVYNAFLNLLTINEDHISSLQKLGFSIEEIKKYGFKSIPNNDETKINICKKLIKEGYNLEKIPGFFQDTMFRWNFSSHKGIFVPVINNCKIIGIRIHLDETYNVDTTDIWFSSSNKYNGAKMNNNIMIMLPEEERLHLMNEEQSKRNVIIASEMLLAYKIKNKYKDKIVIAIPNVISNDEIKKLETLKGIDNVFIVSIVFL